MKCLSHVNPPFDNLTYLAHQPAMMTEYTHAVKEFNQQEFHAKIRDCKITAIAIIALGILTAVLIKLTSGFILGSLSAIPLIILKYQMDKQEMLLNKIHQKANDIDIIVNAIIADLQIYQSYKEKCLVEAFNLTASKLYGSSSLSNALDLLNYYNAEYNDEKLAVASSHATLKCYEYVKRMKLAQLILNQKPPVSFPDGKWNKLERACFIYLYGQGSIAPWIHGDRWSKNEPYIKLEMDAKTSQWFAKVY